MNRRDIKQAVAGAAQLNLLERGIAAVAPQFARKRQQARMMMAVAGGYFGGSRSRRQTSQWKHSVAASADADLNPDLPELRDRSRDLIRNTPIAGGAINTVVTNVVGTGLMPRSQPDAEVLGMTEEAAAAWAKEAEREFELWQRSCDITRTQDFYEIQDLVLRSTLESGDIVVLTPMRRFNGEVYGLKLQLVEADRLMNQNRAADRPTLSGGVEMDLTGAPIKYHITKQHPGAVGIKGALEWDIIDAFGARTGRRNVLHCFKRLRPGQTRGEPYLAPVIEPLKQIGTYTQAEIDAAVVAGMFTVFVHTENGQGIDPANQTGIATETGARSGDTDIKLASGAIVDLAENEKIETANPGRPNSNFEPFVEAIFRQIGVRLELPFEVLIKHYTASYSAARAAILEAWRFFKTRRAWLAGKFCQPVWEMFIEEAVALGRLSAPGFFADPRVRMAYCCATWHGDGPGAIDPSKEVDAADKRVQMCLTTLDQETAEYNGGDWQRNITQRTREHAAMKAADLLPAPKPAPGRPPADNPADAGGDYEDPAPRKTERTTK